MVTVRFARRSIKRSKDAPHLALDQPFLSAARQFARELHLGQSVPNLLAVAVVGNHWQFLCIRSVTQRCHFCLVGIPSPINGAPTGPEEAPQQGVRPPSPLGLLLFQA